MPQIQSFKEKLLVAGVDLHGALLKQAAPVAHTKERSSRDYLTMVYNSEKDQEVRNQLT